MILLGPCWPLLGSSGLKIGAERSSKSNSKNVQKLIKKQQQNDPNILQFWNPKWTPKPAKSGDSNGCSESKPRGVSPELPQRAQDLPKRGPRHPKTAQDRLQTAQDKPKPGPRVFGVEERPQKTQNKLRQAEDRFKQGKGVSPVLSSSRSKTAQGKTQIFTNWGFCSSPSWGD